MTPLVANLFGPPRPGADETVISLLEGARFRLEQIVSHGQATERGFWYDQPAPEWVLLVRGAAKLTFEKEESRELKAGDYLLIPAHLKHRVEHCTLDAVWLALHYRASER